MSRTVAGWADYRAKTNAMRAEADRFDREELGIEPLGKPASQTTKQERAEYEERRAAAMRRKGILSIATGRSDSEAGS